ncbi:type II toxin-antitoxin system PemK/MazF family toxin [Metabacillus litoralis]|uniref:type II toxin-antitoxin system PemK/MazF family toxin n=1 Tax=Metabacillus litoralis TaxID=152268 RepID=UPI000EF5D2D4|nr:type II toxin-antitoxin system PemK/MazF family toxin [Metabacillus litoralis]
MKKQGYLYWGNVPDNTGVSGKRPFLVLSNNQVNNNSVIVAPLRSIKSSIATHITIASDSYPFKDGSILLDQITTIKEEYLQEEICKIRDENYSKVKETLRMLFSL